MYPFVDTVPTNKPFPQVAEVEPTSQTRFVLQDSETLMAIGLFLTYPFPNCIKSLLNNFFFFFHGFRLH